jgi:6-phosphogluconate dehydrogenase
MGVSGGEEGALLGPSLMPGGPREAYDELAPILTRIAAQVADGPCVTWIGPGAAGHFVKMVHNGIEYGDMQLIAEAYDLLTGIGGADNDALARLFARWNEGPLESFLIEITAKIFARNDPDGSGRLVDAILDVAGQKGTGRWTAEIALELGVPVPTIQAAVLARGLSAMHAQRQRAAEILRGPRKRNEAGPGFADAVHDALYASKICSYAQGLDLLATASREHGWELDLAEIARIWKGGCIIRARMLDRIQAAFSSGRAPDNLLLDPELSRWIDGAQDRWREAIATGTRSGVPLLAMAGSLSYFDSYRRARLPQNLTQAQRDFFGAHTYERIDRPRGQSFHTSW